MNKITSMELLTLLHKSDNSVTNLSTAEHHVLSVIITYINHKLEKGYEAWPSLETIVAKTGLSLRGIHKCKDKLCAAGWITLMSGKGRGCSNHYFVNADKIIFVASASGVIHSGASVAKTIEIPEQKEHERNTSGLMQGKVQPTIMHKGNSDGSPNYSKNGVRCYSWKDHNNSVTLLEDDPECPF